jgi:hypothetical protein
MRKHYCFFYSQPAYESVEKADGCCTTQGPRKLTNTNRDFAGSWVV